MHLAANELLSSTVDKEGRKNVFLLNLFLNILVKAASLAG